MKLLLYCTKAKPKLVEFVDEEVKKEAVCRFGTEYNRTNEKYYKKILNGKIVGECEFKTLPFELSKNVDDNNETFFEFLVMKHSCLTYQELKDYLQGKCGYAIYIKNLVIYDEPRELREFKANYHIYDKFYDEPWAWHWVDKAPQNMMYVEDNGVKKILISIRPEWLCKILNGEKTIEVRKKVLKEMI